MKNMTGVPKNEMWWFWAFIIFLIMSIGPGMQLFSVDVFIGPFPLLYWQELLAFAVALFLSYVAGYKLKCTQVDDFAEEILAEERIRHQAEEEEYAKKKGGK